MTEEEMAPYLTFIKRNNASLHVGQRAAAFQDQSWQVFDMFKSDFTQSVKPWIEELLDANYRILFYNGNFDVIVAPPLTAHFLTTLKWSKADRYYSAPRSIYRVAPDDHEVAGYVKRLDNLYFAVIRNAGHQVTGDQPRVTLDMITRFVKGIEF